MFDRKKYKRLIMRGYKLVGMCFLFLLMVFVAEAQGNKRTEKLFEAAKNLYVENNFSKAIDVCNQILKIDSNNVDTHLLMAEIYHELDSTKAEIKHLTKARKTNYHPLVDFRLGEAFYKMGLYSEAMNFYNEYKVLKNIPEKRQYLLACKIASCEFAIQSIQNPVDFEPQNMGDQINSENDEYWPTPTLDGKRLVFTRLIKDEGKRPQEDFFMAELDSIEWEVEAMEGVNTSGNEGAQTLSADARMMFFTACNRQDGLGSCDIYFSRFINGRWSEPKNAGQPLNTASWESQPSFSSDSRYLYFSSDRPDGKGEKDIWRIGFHGFDEAGNPVWAKPENLAVINTTGNEISPFIHANNRNFYFASDTQIGMGGYDLFSALIDEKGEISEMKNMGYPINTYKDDMGMTINSIGDTAYFSSAREADRGLDIFSFNLTRGMRPQPVTYVKATVRNKNTHEPIAADIELVNLNSRFEQATLQQADDKGEVMLALPLRRNYAFNVSEDGFMFYSRSVQLEDENTLTDPIILDIELEPIEVGALMELHNIYFETDSFAILPTSASELQNLVAFLKNNNRLKVEIQGHTDSSGNPQSNLELSKRRAGSVVDYLVQNGISLNRLSSEGYGDTLPIAGNDTAEGKQLNRRTTIKILAK